MLYKYLCSPEIQLLPKTPSAKRARKQHQNHIIGVVEESTEDDECAPHKKSRYSNLSN